jgi:hypothetical protein
MNTAEANDVNTVLGALLVDVDDDLDEDFDAKVEAARAAAVRLADAAHETLGAGLDGPEVDRIWQGIQDAQDMELEDAEPAREIETVPTGDLL